VITRYLAAKSLLLRDRSATLPLVLKPMHDNCPASVHTAIDLPRAIWLSRDIAFGSTKVPEALLILHTRSLPGQSRSASIYSLPLRSDPDVCFASMSPNTRRLSTSTGGLLPHEFHARVFAEDSRSRSLPGPVLHRSNKCDKLRKRFKFRFQMFPFAHE
jgi:hypothetical protein